MMKTHNIKTAIKYSHTNNPFFNQNLIPRLSTETVCLGVANAIVVICGGKIRRTLRKIELLF